MMGQIKAQIPLVWYAPWMRSMKLIACAAFCMPVFRCNHNTSPATALCASCTKAALKETQISNVSFQIRQVEDWAHSWLCDQSQISKFGGIHINKAVALSLEFLFINQYIIKTEKKSLGL